MAREARENPGKWQNGVTIAFQIGCDPPLEFVFSVVKIWLNMFYTVYVHGSPECETGRPMTKDKGR